ncbi:hypothetical protein J5N97_020157 [Dioscorea zingiberensis]|uniref:ZF-HD dimerization-type domain-containing protein n=1 Tax=Dioscorea zingiberensis TaxID=325984 RepID=A0A9D5HDJ6_9LILI|nr:hypothetical protein J5N97_020157 [Dioscorea zingiberensis]
MHEQLFFMWVFTLASILFLKERGMDLSGHGHGHGHGREGVEMAIPITSSYMGHQAHSQGIMNGPHPPPPPPSTSITEEQQQQQQQQQHHQQNQNQNQNQNQKKGSTWVKYKECLKNHAASIGGNATDGCGEFMPSGEEGTIEALKCSACNCHRNFHRKESEGPETYSLIPRSAGAHMVMPLGSFQTSESDEMDRHQHQHQHQAPLMRKRF